MLFTKLLSRLYWRGYTRVDFIREFNGIEMSVEEFKSALKERLRTTDIEVVKQDVIPFVNNVADLDIWSNDYFLQIADMIVFK